MSILYLDLGSNVGLAWYSTRRQIYATAKWELPKKATRNVKLLALACKLREFLDNAQSIDTVAYERPFCRGMAATRFMWGMAGVVESVAEAAGRACVDAELKTVKKFITGSGAAEKADMIAAVRDFGYTGDDEHEADALAGLLYVEATIVRGDQ